MASLIPSGSATGSGSVTLTVPTTNSNQTATLPDATGTVMVSGNMPVFAAYSASNQTLSAGVTTKINYDTLSSGFGSSNSWDTTNKRFTATVAGYYQIEGAVYSNSSWANQSTLYIYVNNGSQILRCQDVSSTSYNLIYSAVVYLAVGDYVEVFANASLGNTTLGNASLSWVRGFMVRTA